MQWPWVNGEGTAQACAAFCLARAVRPLPPPHQSDPRGKQQSEQLRYGQSDWAICGTQIFGSQTPPRKTKGTIVGNNEICRWENLVGPFLVHNILGPRPPPPPSPPPLQHSPGADADGRRSHRRWLGLSHSPGRGSGRTKEHTSVGRVHRHPAARRWQQRCHPPPPPPRALQPRGPDGFRYAPGDWGRAGGGGGGMKCPPDPCPGLMHTETQRGRLWTA